MCIYINQYTHTQNSNQKKKVQMDTAKELLKYVNEPPMGAEDFYTDVIFANLINVLEMHTLRRVVNTNNGGVEKSGQMKTTTDPDKEPQTDRNDPSFLFTKVSERAFWKTSMRASKRQAKQAASEAK